MTTLAASIANNNGSIVIGALQPSAMIPSETQPPLLMNTIPAACINKSLDAKKYKNKKEILIIDLFYLDSIC
jgi:hypothetical protein